MTFLAESQTKNPFRYIYDQIPAKWMSAVHFVKRQLANVSMLKYTTTTMVEHGNHNTC